VLVTALVAGLVGLPSAATGVALDPAVQQAQDRLEQAREQQRATAAQLDALAETFERARSHAERLGDELEGADDRVAVAEDLVAEARRAHDAQVRAAYMQPGLDLLRVSGAFLLAPDVETALHASAVMQRVAATRGSQLTAARRLGQQVVQDVGTQNGIADGTSAALQDLESLAETFTAALDVATAQVATAEADLSTAEAEAEAAAEAREQALALGQVAGFQGLVGGVAPGPIRVATVNGVTQEMTCPLGQPNGFIDSWGFPRSGGRTHKGVDMFAAYGMPLVAAADGVVQRVFNNALGGLSVDLVDRAGNRYYYAHLSAAFVVPGQQVAVGQLLGANGNSGNARYTPPHLHWQFHPGGGGPVNPFPLAAALCR
jgi:murein DD-endopeptidase MepM/ murein hydrolase activator NlpD